MHAQTTVTPSTPRGLAPVKRVLDNGATIIAKESRATPAVTLHASVRARVDPHTVDQTDAEADVPDPGT